MDENPDLIIGGIIKTPVWDSQFQAELLIEEGNARLVLRALGAETTNPFQSKPLARPDRVAKAFRRLRDWAAAHNIEVVG